MAKARVCTFKELWPGEAAKYPEKAEWVCVYIPRGKRPIRRVYGPPGPESEGKAHDALEIALRRRTARAVGRPLFEEVADQYLEAGMEIHQLAKSTRATRTHRVRRLIREFPGYHLDEIDRREVGKLWERLTSKKQDDPVGRETGRRYLAALSSIYRYASIHYTVTNPVRGFLPQLNEQPTKATRAAAKGTANPIESPKVIDALVKACHELGDPHVYTLLLLMLEHGQRRGEAMAARRMDMRLGQGPNAIGRLVWLEKNRPRDLDEEAPKSGRERGVPMSRRLHPHILEHYAVVPQDRPLVEPWGNTGEYFQKHAFPRVCQKAGVERWLPKDLRDSFASHLLSAGFPVVQIMRWMGHAPGSYAMFRNRYAKWIGADDNEWAYKAPIQLQRGEVPTDIFARLSAIEAERHINE